MDTLPCHVGRTKQRLNHISRTEIHQLANNRQTFVADRTIDTGSIDLFDKKEKVLQSNKLTKNTT